MGATGNGGSSSAGSFDEVEDDWEDVSEDEDESPVEGEEDAFADPDELDEDVAVDFEGAPESDPRLDAVRNETLLIMRLGRSLTERRAPLLPPVVLGGRPGLRVKPSELETRNPEAGPACAEALSVVCLPSSS